MLELTDEQIKALPTRKRYYYMHRDEINSKRAHPRQALEVVDKIYYLGKLCPGRHGYKGTGRSLRYVSTGHCVKCRAEWSKERRERK
jgi:hypothetical protein